MKFRFLVDLEAADTNSYSEFVLFPNGGGRKHDGIARSLLTQVLLNDKRHLLGKQALYSKQTLFVLSLLASFLAFRKRKLLRIFIRLKYFDILI